MCLSPHSKDAKPQILRKLLPYLTFPQTWQFSLSLVSTGDKICMRTAYSRTCPIHPLGQDFPAFPLPALCRVFNNILPPSSSDYWGKGRALLQAATSPSCQALLLERHRGLASPTGHHGYLCNIFPSPFVQKAASLSPHDSEEQKSNPGAPSCRNCTLLEASTADGCSCSSQLGRQPPAPTHQPRGSGVLRKERISEDFNAGLGCPKFSLFLLPPAQPMEAGISGVGYSLGLPLRVATSSP